MLLRSDKYLLKMTTAPVDVPVSVQELADDLRLVDLSESSKLESLVLAATEYVSGPLGVTGRALLNATWALSVGAPDRNYRVYLPLLPAVSVTSITYFDGADVSQTLDPANFHVRIDDEFAFIEPKQGFAWPGTADRPDAITITYVAGYGSDSDQLPNTAKLAIRLLAAHWYENRTAASDKPLHDIPMGVDALLGTLRSGWVG